MPEIASPAAALAASGLVYSSAVAIGLPVQLALPVAVAAAGGASWALSNRPRVEQWTLGAIGSALAAWFMSWLLGVAGGPICAAFAAYYLPAEAVDKLPMGALTVGLALIISAFGISVILPSVLKRFSHQVEG